ncbi:MAG: hypothetical protein DYH04_17250 [Nitrospira sp. NTP2]|nr:hypothetical protein [Nitrospira sp.]MCE7967096.1 hypothetical protein [Nitrospira sp. NTP2]
MSNVSAVRLTKPDLEIAVRLAGDFLGEASVNSERLIELLDDERSIVLAAFDDGVPIAYLVAYCYPSLSGKRCLLC